MVCLRHAPGASRANIDALLPAGPLKPAPKTHCLVFRNEVASLGGIFSGLRTEWFLVCKPKICRRSDLIKPALAVSQKMNPTF